MTLRPRQPLRRKHGPGTGCLWLTLLLGSGCQANSPQGFASAPRDAAAAVQQLHRDAERERAAPSTPRAAALPPGVDPTLLLPAEVGDHRAAMPLADAVREVASTVQLPDEAAAATEQQPAEPELALEERIEAQAHYVRGREAGLEGRHFLAIQEFEQALALDPNSIAILRQLARSYALAGNAARSGSLYELILTLSPHDSESAFTLGGSAVRNGQFAQAVALLGPARLRGEGFTHDPAANLLTDRFLAIALHQLGYMRGELEALLNAVAGLDTAAGPSAYASEVAWMEVRRSEFLRSIGDTHCRLGEFERALAAYEEAAMLEGADRAALAPRLIYAFLRTGRPAAARGVFLEAVSSAGHRLDARLIDLAAYLRSEGAANAALALALQPAVAAGADPVHAARLAAALLPPDESAAELRRLVSRNPDSLETVAQLFRALAPGGDDDARPLATFAIGLAEDHPDRALDHARVLFAEFGLWPDLIAALRRDGRGVARLLEARLFLVAGAPASAWHASAAGLERDPALIPLHITQIEACGSMGESSLLDAAARAAPADDPRVLIAIARAEEAVGRFDRALAAAQRAAELAPERAAAHATLARLLAREPATAPSAEASAERALTLEPGMEGAYDVLVTLHRPDGALPDQMRLQDTVNRLRAEAPQGRLLLLLAADERTAQRRFAQAIEILLALHERTPEDGEALRRLTLAWLQSDQSVTARRWLGERLAQRPHDPNLLQQLVRVHLSVQEFIEAENLLRQRLEDWPEDPLAKAMLEVVLQAQGRNNEAWALAEERLLARPAGPRREIERASLRIAMGEIDQAIDLLAPLLDSLAELARADALLLLGTAMQLDESRSPRAQPFRQRALREVLARFPDAPLSAYAAAITSALERGASAAEISTLIDNAIAHADAGGPSQEAQQYRAVAQQLISAGHHEPAADLLARRFAHSRPLAPDSRALLAQVTQAALVRAGRTDDLLGLLDQLDEEGVLATIYPRSERPQLDALYSASLLATLIGRDDVGDRLLAETLRLDPGHAMTLNNLGYHRIEEGAADAETADMIERAHKFLPDDPSILDTIAWLRYRQGRFGDHDGSAGDGALNLLERSIERTLADGGRIGAEVLDHRGDTLWRLGDHDGAIESWSDAIEAVEDDGFRQTTTQDFERFLANNWGLIVMPPAEMFELAYGPILARAREKLSAAEAGRDPPLAPTFAELAD